MQGSQIKTSANNKQYYLVIYYMLCQYHT